MALRKRAGKKLFLTVARARHFRKGTTMKPIVAVLALAIAALAGCASTTKQREPTVAPSAPAKNVAPVATTQTVRPTPAASPHSAAQPPATATPAVPQTPLFATGACPNGYRLVARAFSLKELPEDLREEVEKLMRAATERETRGATRLEAYQTNDSLPRVLGKRLRTEIKTLAKITTDASVRYVEKNPQTRAVSARDIGVLKMVNGFGAFQFSDDPRSQIIETSWSVTEFISPEVSGGERRWRLFPLEWANWCTMNLPVLVP